MIEPSEFMLVPLNCPFWGWRPVSPMTRTGLITRRPGLISRLQAETTAHPPELNDSPSITKLRRLEQPRVQRHPLHHGREIGPPPDRPQEGREPPVPGRGRRAPRVAVTEHELVVQDLLGDVPETPRYQAQGHQGLAVASQVPGALVRLLLLVVMVGAAEIGVRTFCAPWQQCRQKCLNIEPSVSVGKLVIVVYVMLWCVVLVSRVYALFGK